MSKCSNSSNRYHLVSSVKCKNNLIEASPSNLVESGLGDLCDNNSLINEAIHGVDASFATCIREYLTIRSLFYKRISKVKFFIPRNARCIRCIAT